MVLCIHLVGSQTRTGLFRLLLEDLDILVEVVAAAAVLAVGTARKPFRLCRPFPRPTKVPRTLRRPLPDLAAGLRQLGAVVTFRER